MSFVCLYTFSISYLSHHSVVLKTLVCLASVYIVSQSVVYIHRSLLGMNQIDTTLSFFPQTPR